MLQSQLISSFYRSKVVLLGCHDSQTYVSHICSQAIFGKIVRIGDCDVYNNSSCCNLNPFRLFHRATNDEDRQQVMDRNPKAGWRMSFNCIDWFIFTPINPQPSKVKHQMNTQGRRQLWTIYNFANHWWWSSTFETQGKRTITKHHDYDHAIEIQAPRQASLLTNFQWWILNDYCRFVQYKAWHLIDTSSGLEYQPAFKVGYFFHHLERILMLLQMVWHESQHIQYESCVLLLVCHYELSVAIYWCFIIGVTVCAKHMSNRCSVISSSGWIFTLW